MCSARLLIIGGRELLSKEGTTQGYPHQWVLILSEYYHCFSFCSISFELTNSMVKRLLLQMTLWLLAKYQALKTTGAN